MRIHRTILAATLALACGPALADGHQHGSDAAKHGDMKARCEMMHDGKMTPEEHRKHADEMFQKLDANKDGTITRAEFDQHHEDMMKRHHE